MKVSTWQDLGYGLCVVALAAGMASSSPAFAAYRNASAGAACHAANGALASKFTFNLNYLTNVGTTDAYVICNLAIDDAIGTPDTVTRLTVSLVVPTQGATVSCVAQAGAFYNGTNHIIQSLAESDSADVPNAVVFLSWDQDLVRGDALNVLTLNCKLPAGTKMGLIERWESPSS